MTRARRGELGYRGSAMVQSSIRVRRAEATDADAIARVHIQAWQRALRGQIPDRVLDALDERARAARCRVELAAKDSWTWVAEQHDRVLGFCLLRGSKEADVEVDVGEVVALYVHPNDWRQGAGRALIDAVVDAAPGCGFSALTLWVLEANARARNFYEHMGFDADGKSKVEQRASYSLHELRYRRALSSCLPMN